MRRRAFLRSLPAAAATLGLGQQGHTDALVRWLRREHGWAARLDDPAYGGRGDGATLNDGPLLQALADMPADGGTIVIPPQGPWLFDAVDLARIGRRNVRLVTTGARLVKAPRTANHMFRDEHGASHGLTVVGGAYDLSAGAFGRGATVSAFHLVRADDLTFVDVTVTNGIEEGLKLYTPRRLRVLRGRFERLVNNGIQIHAPASDGFLGDAPPRDTEDIFIEGATFRDVDDGLHGMEGQGVSVSGASPRVTARNVRVTRCTFERCVRGAWAEFNEPGVPGEDIRFDGNLVLGAECHGLGLVGVRGGGMRGNHVLDTGRVVPGRRGVVASETAGLVLSGSEGTPGEDLIVEDNQVIEGRLGPEAKMQYGIVVRRQLRLVERRNVVRGATVRGVQVER
jgi:hypothetical protein